jgi:predicted DCC family thiol-disulfide oxidoreductase YuxK
MSAVYPLTLLYDANCPVCALEMDHLRSRNAAGRLVFVDIAAIDFDAAHFGTPWAELDAEIHAVCADGSVLRGMQVLRLAYAAVGLGWVLRPTGLAPLRPGFDWAYRLFARHRREISSIAAPLINAVRGRRARRLAARMASCHGGACAPRAAPHSSPIPKETA